MKPTNTISIQEKQQAVQEVIKGLNELYYKLYNLSSAKDPEHTTATDSDLDKDVRDCLEEFNGPIYRLGTFYCTLVREEVRHGC